MYTCRYAHVIFNEPYKLETLFLLFSMQQQPFTKHKEVLLCNHSTATKIRKYNIDSILLPNPHFISISCPSNGLCSHPVSSAPTSSKSNPRSCIVFSRHVLLSFNLEEFLSFSLSFLTMTFLKSTDQLFWKMSLHLGLSDVSMYIFVNITFLFFSFFLSLPPSPALRWWEGNYPLDGDGFFTRDLIWHYPRPLAPVNSMEVGCEGSPSKIPVLLAHGFLRLVGQTFMGAGFSKTM